MSKENSKQARAHAGHEPSQPPHLMATPMRWIVGGAILLAIIVFFSVASDDWITIVNYTMIAAIAAGPERPFRLYRPGFARHRLFHVHRRLHCRAARRQFANRPLDPNGLALSWLIWLPAAGIVAALVGALIGPSALRLKGFYLGIVSLALVFIGQYIF